MKQLIATLVVLGLIGGGGYAYMLHYQATTTARDYDEALQELQRQFTERLGPVRSMEEKAQYDREIGALLSWYFAELQKLRNRFPGLGDPDRVFAEFEAEHDAGRMSAQDLEQYRGHFDYVRWVFERLENGDYEPQLTGFGSNLRFDVYDLDRDRFENQPQVRMDFILWGAPRNIEEREERRGVTVRRVNVPVRFGRIFFQFLNEQGHIHGEMSGSTGEPYLKIEHPERWIPEFPPMAVLGRYWIELFPDEAHEFVWELDLSGHTTGGTRFEANYRWELEVPRSWQVGGEWGGTETIRDEEYIRRTAGR
jgi:hypothetical protein